MITTHSTTLAKQMRVTSILDAAGVRSAWAPGISEEERAFYLERGTAIHAACAIIDRNEVLDPSTIDPRILPYVTAWHRFRRETVGYVVAVELTVISTRFNYVGHLDVIIKGCAIAPRDVLVLDRKTTEAAPETRLQTIGYMDAWLEQLKRNGFRRPPQNRVKRGAIALRKDGTWGFDPYKDDAVDRAAWHACLTLASWKQRLGLIE